MRYESTRGAAPEVGFREVLLEGLAPDGGLYVPSRWPVLAGDALERLTEAPYEEIAVEVIAPFVEPAIDVGELAGLVAAAYRSFDDPAVAPLRPLGDPAEQLWLLELFHGPTLAFKDVALQLVGHLFERELQRIGERIVILTATSGDTGSAAIEACRGRDALEIFVLHPHGRVSEVQRRQMTTVDAPNVHNLAIEGTFDDCQDLVKAMFSDDALRSAHRLSAMNSINWARVVAQVVYYVVAAARLGAGPRPVSFAVPTGNFGNVFAAHVARRMGVPVEQLVIASNRNDVLSRWLHTGAIELAEVHPTLSPAMDIQVSSNHERLLFELVGRDGGRLAALMRELRSTGRAELPPEVMAEVREVWSATSVDDEATTAEIRTVHEQHGVLVDPHTAVGLAAARSCRGDPGVPMVALATAHPAKFPDAVERAIGIRPPLPDRLADVLERPEHLRVLPATLPEVRAHIVETLAPRPAPAPPPGGPSPSGPTAPAPDC